MGRRDKIFCSPKCKAVYHRRRKKQVSSVSKKINSILHRNWVVLSELYEEIGRKKFFIPVERLNKAGFHLNYYTTSNTNKKGKTYYYIYDFGWMQFSEKEMMIVKLAKPK